jgi:hypothetical protein
MRIGPGLLVEVEVEAVLDDFMLIILAVQLSVATLKCSSGRMAQANISVVLIDDKNSFF